MLPSALVGSPTPSVKSDTTMPKVINTVTKASPSDNYAVFKDTDGLGGYRVVDLLVERDAIVTKQRKERMIVFVREDGHYYDLRGGILNANWYDIGTELGKNPGIPYTEYRLGNDIKWTVNNLLLDHTPIIGTLLVEVDGLGCTEGDDFTLAGNILTWIGVTKEATDKFIIYYRYLV